jgi:N-sulfoglucosamine sulfohydrolase
MALSRRGFLAGMLLGSAPAIAQQRRNILLLIADDLGNTLKSYGDPAAITPRIDQLASQGTRFTRAFCTTASCSPSRSVIMTGLQNHANGHYGLAHGNHNFALRRGVRMLPELLKASGYRTGAVGKFHVNPPTGVPHQAAWDLLSEEGGRDGASLADRTHQFLAAAAGRPFFLQVGFTDPHRDARDFANRDYPGVVRRRLDPARVPVPAWLPDSAAVRADLAEYYESVHRLDQNVGLVLDALSAAGQAASTLIVFLSDNGMPFPNAKTTLYEAGTRLPLIIRAPGARRGMVNSAMVSWADLMPTLLEWAGATLPGYPLHGRSLLPILEQENPSGWDRVFFSHTFHEITMYYPMRALRTRRYKYIRNLAHSLPFPLAQDLSTSVSWRAIRDSGSALGSRPLSAFLHRPAEELYDLEADPDEIRNLSSLPEQTQTLAELRALMADWRRSTGDPWAANEERA